MFVSLLNLGPFGVVAFVHLAQKFLDLKVIEFKHSGQLHGLRWVVPPLFFDDPSEDINPLVLGLDLFRNHVQDDFDQDDKALVDLGHQLEQLQTQLGRDLEVNCLEETHHAH